MNHLYMNLLKFGVCAFYLVCIWLPLSAQPTTVISDSLKNGADAVYRKYITSIEYSSSSNKLTISRHIEVTVLNEKGRFHSDFIVPYDADKPIKNMIAYLYDENGKKIKTFKGDEIKGYSLFSESTLFHDNRQKQIEVYAPKYPYTAVFEYTQQYNQFIGIPSWYPQVGYRVGVEYTSFSITYSNYSPVRYKLFNIPEPVKESLQPDVTSLTWELQNLKPINEESFSSKFFEQTPALMLVPECFSYKGTNGCFTSWGTYGEWVSSLIKSRADYSDDMLHTVQNLIKNVSNEKEKIRIIYKYMQDHTRYVSIQLGLGGYQPFPATQVEATGWGDCKALVNYTKTLLSLANIKSYYCEIGVSNTQIMFDDFPSAGQTNHIILGVPLESDTLWLECTDQHIPFGYLPYSLQNQKVLWVDESKNTGYLVNTPNPDANYNSRKRYIEFNLDSSGNAQGKMLTLVQGGEISKLFPELWAPSEEKERIINNKYSVPGFKITSFDYTLKEGDHALATEKIEMTFNKFASKTGERLFVKSNLFGGISEIPVKTKYRRSPLVIRHSYFHSDTVLFNLPKGYDVEYIPQQKVISKSFGELVTRYIIRDNEIIYVRDLKINRYKGSSKEYNDFIDFLIQVNRSDEQNIILVKKRDTEHEK